MLWIGTRTKQLDGAHTEYFRGIANPIGIKVGSDISPENAVSLIRILDPTNTPGKITLISRYGSANVSVGLPMLAEAISRAQLRVVWLVDPMHGNTHKSNVANTKTRSTDDIFHEIQQTHKILQRHGQHLGGIHLELCGDDVTECIDGVRVKEENLGDNWQSACDPRLNYDQCIEMAYRVSELLAEDLKNPSAPHRQN